MKINTSHLVGAAIALAAVFFSKLDAQDAPAKAEPQKWEYAFIRTSDSGIRMQRTFNELLDVEGKKVSFSTATAEEGYPYGLELFFNGDDRQMMALTEIQKMGDNGWELINTIETSDWRSYDGSKLTIHYFKRPVQ